MHQLTLTDDELRDLALLAYLGNRLANGRNGEGSEIPNPDLAAALQKIYGLAYEAGLRDLHVVEDSRGELSCLQHDSPGLHEEAHRVQELIEEYDEQAAFEITAEELADRDGHRLAHTATGQKMTDSELGERNAEAYDHYMREFEAHGFERLVVNRNMRPLPCQDASQAAAGKSHPQQR